MIMALCCFASPEEREAARRSKEIDRYLERERLRCWREVKILLLGASGSGKSTFLKQMRILHGKGYTEENRLRFRPDIYATILNGMRDVILCLKEHQIPLQDSQNEKNCQAFSDLWHGVSHGLTDVEFCSAYVKPLMSLWRDQGIQATVEEANQYYLKSSFHYFMKNIDTIGQLGYIPSIQDVLHCRTQTIGIHEELFTIDDKCYLFITVGGSRNSSSKWRKVFDDVTLIMYFSASDEFDQTLREDLKFNFLTESVNMFEMITYNRLLESVPIVLILNKTDLLAEKIKAKSIKDHFPNFEGNPRDIEDVQKFIIQMYDTVRPLSKSDNCLHVPAAVGELCSYSMTATDEMSVRTVFPKVRDTILTKHL